MTFYPDAAANPDWTFLWGVLIYLYQKYTVVAMLLQQQPNSEKVGELDVTVHHRCVYKRHIHWQVSDQYPQQNKVTEGSVCICRTAVHIKSSWLKASTFVALYKKYVSFQHRVLWFVMSITQGCGSLPVTSWDQMVVLPDPSCSSIYLNMIYY